MHKEEESHVIVLFIPWYLYPHIFPAITGQYFLANISQKITKSTSWIKTAIDELHIYLKGRHEKHKIFTHVAI